MRIAVDKKSYIRKKKSYHAHMALPYSGFVEKGCDVVFVAPLNVMLCGG